MENTFNIPVYDDIAHGWGEVKRSALIEFGVYAAVSSYSYQHAGFVYLEKDCDLSLFCEALSARGIKPVFSERTTEKDSIVRTYSRFRA